MVRPPICTEPIPLNCVTGSSAASWVLVNPCSCDALSSPSSVDVNPSSWVAGSSVLICVEVRPLICAIEKSTNWVSKMAPICVVVSAPISAELSPFICVAGSNASSSVKVNALT